MRTSDDLLTHGFEHLRPYPALLYAAVRELSYLAPPWQTIPQACREPKRWQMGVEEDVMCEWQVWFRALSPRKRAEYRRRHPEPATMRGFYDRIDKND